MEISDSPNLGLSQICCYAHSSPCLLLHISVRQIPKGRIAWLQGMRSSALVETPKSFSQVAVLTYIPAIKCFEGEIELAFPHFPSFLGICPLDPHCFGISHMPSIKSLKIFCLLFLVLLCPSRRLHCRSQINCYSEQKSSLHVL